MTTFDAKDTVLTSFGQIGDSIYYVDENGDSSKVLANQETLTTIALSSDTLIYTDEDNNETKIYLEDLDTTNELIDSVKLDSFLNSNSLDTLKIFQTDTTFSIVLEDLDSTNEKIDTIYIEGDSIILVEGGDTLFLDYSDGDWRVNSNGTGLQGIPGNNTAGGINSLAAGLGNSASGFTATSLGGSANASSGLASVNVGGSSNSVSGTQSLNIGGFSNTVSGFKSFSLAGESNTVLGDYAGILGGRNNTAYSYGEIVLGYYNTVYTPGSAIAIDTTDKLFVIGNGASTSSRSNALTLLKDGRLGLGVDGDALQTASLHIKPQTAIDPLRLEDLNMAQPNDTAVLAVNPSNGTVRYLSLDSIGIIDSLSHIRNDTLSVHQGNSVSKVSLANTMSEIYDTTGGFTIPNTFTDVPMATSGIVDPNYTTTATTITVRDSGRYKITYRVTLEFQSGGNNRSESEHQLLVNGTVVPGSYAAAYHRNGGVNTGTVTVTRVLNLPANAVVKVQSQKSSGGAVLQTKANGSSLLIERL